MTDVEINVLKILNGEPSNGTDDDICDFNLEDINSDLESQGIQPIIDPSYKPILGETITYIVAVVLLNEQNEILMIQEAKESCAGKWYLPAGRVDKGETIYKAAQREVKEETGLDIECKTLVTVEYAGRFWIRFVLTGTIIGGSLKTPQQADKESLQAKWISDLNQLTLRSSDIIHLIDKTRAFKEARKNKDSTWYTDLLPTIQEHEQLLLRLVIVIKKKSTNKIHLLVSERSAQHLPTCQIHPKKSIYFTLKRFMINLFGAEVSAHRSYGILSVEHDGTRGLDGICFTILIAFKAPLEEVPIIGKCAWYECSENLGAILINKVSSKNATIPLHVIQ